MLKLNILETVELREPLCPTCTYAVVQSGFDGEKLTYCTLGGAVRELTFAVSECTAYTDRRIARTERVAGFIKPKRQAGHVTVIKIAR